MTINSRSKGARGERELAEFLRGFGIEARRGQQFHGGVDSPDVVCDGLPGFHLECKRVEAGNPYNWLAQSERDAGAKVPLVVHKRNRQDWIVILNLSDFLTYVLRSGQEISPEREGTPNKASISPKTSRTRKRKTKNPDTSES